MDTPLLYGAAESSLLEEHGGDYADVKGFQQAKKVFAIESARIWKIALPIVFNILCQYGVNSITNIFVGHLGVIELSAVSLINSVIGTFAFGFMKDMADLAGSFAFLVIPQFLSLAFNFPTQKFLQAQNLGLTGAAIAFDVTSWGITLAQLVYVVGWCKDGWNGLSWLALKDIWSFVRLSIASAVMLCLEVWYMMSLIVLAGHLDNAIIAVDSISICMNYNGWESMIFIGVNAAISVRVSNELGLRHPRAAKYSVYVTVFQSLFIGIFFMVVILLTKDYFAVVFTNSKDLQAAVANLGNLLAVTMVLNSVQPVISGVAVGGGWQALVAYINVGCYYLFGLPLGYLLGYTAKLGVKGLWGGMICGILLQTLLLTVILYKTNWNKEVDNTTARVQQWGGHAIEEADNKTLASA
ncbi:hypothetical protein TSUD_44170 [Trifolium subterraneum]|uniref:Protein DETOXIFICATION n=1 Tax=Trifolium subterraneum TaxID=3900 RepID=A0A2Z6MIF1_TRISU|nr:hypothetical protein TSUD_44170 [Trifolium subterraneum]